MTRVLLLLRAVATLAPLLLGQAAICPFPVSAAEAGDIGDLPLVELPGPRSDPILVLFLSGDGGWRDLDKTIGERNRQAWIVDEFRLDCSPSFGEANGIRTGERMYMQALDALFSC